MSEYRCVRASEKNHWGTVTCRRDEQGYPSPATWDSSSHMRMDCQDIERIFKVPSRVKSLPFNFTFICQDSIFSFKGDHKVNVTELTSYFEQYL